MCVQWPERGPRWGRERLLDSNGDGTNIQHAANMRSGPKRGFLLEGFVKAFAVACFMSALSLLLSVHWRGRHLGQPDQSTNAYLSY